MLSASKRIPLQPLTQHLNIRGVNSDFIPFDIDCLQSLWFFGLELNLRKFAHATHFSKVDVNPVKLILDSEVGSQLV